VSNLLAEHGPLGSGAYRSVGEWLEAIKMGRYTEIFMENGYSSMDAVAQGFETAWSDSCRSPEEDHEQPSRNEGAAGERNGAIVTSANVTSSSE
ncbi:Hypothetical predicted protein, partial [Marmota monax]